MSKNEIHKSMTSKSNTILNFFLNFQKINGVVLMFFVISFFLCVGSNASAKTPELNQKLSIDRNPVLIADTLKKYEAKEIVRSSVNQLTENIYLSCLGNYRFIKRQFPDYYFNSDTLDLRETIGLNAFYSGNYAVALTELMYVFEFTTNSLQKAQTCLNLIKINYLAKNLEQATGFIKFAQDSLRQYYTYKQKYELIFTEAKIALSRGLTSKAENLIISKVLPMSGRVTGRLNEFHCYLFLGKIYLKSNSLTQAKWFFIQANSLAVQKNYISGQIETSLLLAKTKIKVGDKEVALQDLAKAKRLINADHQIYLADLRSLTKLASR